MRSSQQNANMFVSDTDHSTFVSMNLAGRLSGKEIKRYGQQVMEHILVEKDIGLFYGQQTNFKPSLPRHYEFMGNTKAFMIYNRKHFKVCDEKEYRQYIKDLEMQEHMPRHYLPASNFVICKVKTRSHIFPPCEFISISWLTDECMGPLKATSTLRKLLAFMDNLSLLEQLPVVCSGTFRLPLEDAKKIMPEDFRVCGYMPANKKRNLRSSNYYICSRSLTLGSVKPLVCSKLDLQEDTNGDRWVNPEDAFYWDPVMAHMERASCYNSPVRALSPLPPLPPPIVINTAPIMERAVVTETQEKTEITTTRHVESVTNGLSVPGESEEIVDGMMKRIPSYVELYDEEMLDSNAVCYMQ